MKTTKKALGTIRRVAACSLACIMCLITQGCELLFMAFIVGAMIEGEAGYNNYLDKEYLRSKYEQNMTSGELRTWNKHIQEIKRNMSPEQRRTFGELEREVKREIAKEKRALRELDKRDRQNRLAHERVGKKLEAKGISWHSSGFGDNNYNPSKVKNNTSFVGIKPATVRAVITLKKVSRADIVITGATEDGHDSAYHATGQELDLRKNTDLNSYIEKHYAYIGTNSVGHKQYQAKYGNIYEDAIDHWDVFVSVKPADLAKPDKPAKDKNKKMDANADPRLSGASWVNRYYGSNETSELESPFRENVDAFIAAMKDAGMTVEISATYRTKERQFLMYYSWLIAKKGFDPAKVPQYPGIDIVWVHHNADGTYSKKKSITAAKEMVTGFEIAYKPAEAEKSNHQYKRAIDMTIKWQAKSVTIKNKEGKPIVINTSPHTGSNNQLIKVGATYGVIKLREDPPHWSETGN
jgi:hypothetical protein